MINLLINEIKKKKSLASLDDNFVKDLVLEYFRKYPKIKEKLSEHPKPLKSKEFKVMQKNIRKKLHEVYGIFYFNKNLLKELKAHLKKTKKIDYNLLQLHKEILESHKSTKERLPYYETVYRELFKVTGKPNSILDISCGLNPLSFPFMHLEKVRYIASELTKDDCDFIQEYFNIMKKFGLNGSVIQIDLLKDYDFPKTDICFLFKVLDSLEAIKRNISEKILKEIHSKNIVVSFPTKSICGKKKIRTRGWFLKLLRKLDYEYKKFEIENEEFYVIIKNN